MTSHEFVGWFILGIAILGALIAYINRPTKNYAVLLPSEDKENRYYEFLFHKTGEDTFETERLIQQEQEIDIMITREEATKRALKKLDDKHKSPPFIPPAV